jgi:hypothetical protein
MQYTDHARETTDIPACLKELKARKIYLEVMM